jgi:hypothetical protein
MGLNACGEDPFADDWYDTPDTVTIYSLRLPVERQLSSGFSFYGRTAIRIELAGATGAWDMALDTQGGELVALPPGALGITARAGIASLGAISFTDFVQAPSDTLLYELNDPVPMTLGHVYAVRTNRVQTGFGGCVFYAKFMPVTLDASAGFMDFEYVASRSCNNRELVSPN